MIAPFVTNIAIRNEALQDFIEKYKISLERGSSVPKTRVMDRSISPTSIILISRNISVSRNSPKKSIYV